MLEVSTDVINGIMFVNLNGKLTDDTIMDLDEELSYLLYKQGVHFFILNFKSVEIVSFNAFDLLQNKLIEIMLSSGGVVLCGMKKEFKNKFNLKRFRIASNEMDALKLLSV